MRDVFISYSRKDKPFVEKLHQALEAQNRDTWVDWNDIPLTAEWWQEIQRGIEAANTFVFVISPDSLVSQVCGREIDHAVQHNKRLIPIVYRAVDGVPVHAALQPVQWIFFQDPDRFEPQFQRLITEMDRDLEHVRMHTRLELRAIEWQEQKRNESFGLKGDELRVAEEWLRQGETKEPKPTELQQNYIRASRAVEETEDQAKKRLAIATGISAAMLGVATVGAGFLGVRSIEAQKARQAAELEKETVQQGTVLERKGISLLRQPIHYYRDYSVLVEALQLGREVQSLTHKKNLDSNNALVAVSPLLALRTAVNLNMQQAEFQGFFPRFSPDYKYVLIGTGSTTQLQDLSGRKIAEFQGIFSKFSPDSQKIGVHNNNKIYLHNFMGRKLAEFQGSFLSFSPSSNLVLIGNSTKSQLHDLAGRRLAEFQGSFPSFSPDGKRILTWDSSKIRLYDLAGRRLAEFQGSFPSFSPDGKQILKQNGTETWLCDLKGKKLVEFQGINSSFSPNGKKILTWADNTIRLYDRAGKKLAEFQGKYPRFSPNSRRVMTVSEDVIQIHALTGEKLTEFRGNFGTSFLFAELKTWNGNTLQGYNFTDGTLNELFEGSFPSFSADSNHIITGNGEISQVYDLSGKELLRFRGSSPHFFNFNGQGVVTQDLFGNIRLYNLEGKKLQISLEERNAFSPDSQKILTSDDKRVRLYNLFGKKLAEFQGSMPKFSLDGSRIFTWDDYKSYLHDLSGKKLAEFQGSNPISSPDSKYVLAGNYDRSQLYELSGKKLVEFRGAPQQFSSSGKQILTSIFANAQMLYGVSGKKLSEFRGVSASFSPDGKKILTTGSGAISRLHDLTGKQLAEFQSSDSTFTPSSNHILVRHHGKTYLHDLSGKQLVEFPGILSSFSPDGQKILLDDENTSYLYDLAGKKLLEVPGVAATFSPDGQQVLATSIEEDITRLYDLRGRLLAEYSGSTSSNLQFRQISRRESDNLALGFTQDGTQILTLTNNRILRIWDIDKGLTVDGGLDDLLRQGCEKLKDFRHREDVRKVCPQG
ncbi:toll/interleukin-1 receptor domain-containing protein [Leptolyngbya sp. AN03gr2]|uniref:toll/interleukin-1 receptor domain-containing protein n=1 Tax=unclassified Leptolyngbya TaxID=2650499 RepID=UPI003D322171